MADSCGSYEQITTNSIYTHPFVYRGTTWSHHTTIGILKKCEKFVFRSDDILVATCSRSGTTLTQEIVWQIVNHEVVKKDETYGSLAHRFPFFEFNLEFRGLSEPNPVDTLPTWTKPRLIKTHLPYSLIHDQFEKVNPKMIVVLRNPKDNVVSCFNFYTGHQIIKEGTAFVDYWNSYMSSESINGNFCDLNLQWWHLRDRENVLIVRYEDIIQQPFQEVRKIAMFLGYSLSAEKIDTIVHNTTFDVMSKNRDLNTTLKSGVGTFMRKGKVGDWKTWLTEDQNKVMDAWMSERLKGSSLRFIYEL